MYNKRLVGARQEQKAVEYLKEHEYQIMECNFRCRTGEIDVVANNNGYLVFVEVKYRKSSSMGLPEEAVDYKKMKRISRTAQFYLLKNHIPSDKPCRFDVITILDKDISLIQNAFDALF